ncbi:MAG: arginine--tRNA ligase, partial [bacterium]|nr:arginine--tRNA ligase [bacterium]
MQEIGIENPEVHLEHPEDFAHGDYSTNVALRYAKELKLKPRELAEKIVTALQGLTLNREKGQTFIERIEIAGAGFINFHLSKEFFTKSIGEIFRQAQDYGKSVSLVHKKVLVEYTDPNPFKEFHIGHLMSNTIGESISRLIGARGAEVKRACYQGDVGLHVAKAIWGARSAQIKDLGFKIKEIQEWGKAYALGAEKYETDVNAKKEIEELNKVIYERSDAEINRLHDEGKKVSLAEFERLYKKLSTHFDFYFFESDMAPRGVEIVREGQKKGVFEESEGAIVFKGEQYGLHTRVFINSQGLPTYEAKELALAKYKEEKYPADTSVVITGNEVNEYFRVLLKAMEFLFPALAKKTVHASHGMLRLPSGKMSSRKGDVITAEALISQVEEMVREKIKEREFSKEEKEKITEAVAIGALKYSILRQAVGGDIIFDFEKSISFEGDSGPYLQYSYARAQSVLRKVDKVEPFSDSKVQPPEVGLLERTLYRFPEVVERAGTLYEPHHVVTYLIELSGAFNTWYAQEKIIGSKEEAYRLSLTQAFATVMKNGLSLLGIPVLEQM